MSVCTHINYSTSSIKARRHDLSADCWCGPTVSLASGGHQVVDHHAEIRPEVASTTRAETAYEQSRPTELRQFRRTAPRPVDY